MARDDSQDPLMSAIKRLCIYAHYDKNQLIDDYVVYQLKYYAIFFDKVIFVSTSCAPRELDKIKHFTGERIVRPNSGYDFVSWKTGLESEAELASYDEVILTNDSVYGPLFSVEEMFEKMAPVPCDFWGVSENIEVKLHLQSYFLVFKKNVFTSPTFKTWLDSLTGLVRKKDYVTKFEVALSDNLTAADFKSAVYFKNHFSLAALAYSAASILSNKILSPQKKTQALGEQLQASVEQIQSTAAYSRLRRWITPNPTLRQWKTMVKEKSPFVKVQIFRENPLGENLTAAKKFLKKESTYPTDLIDMHLSGSGKS